MSAGCTLVKLELRRDHHRYPYNADSVGVVEGPGTRHAIGVWGFVKLYRVRMCIYVYQGIIMSVYLGLAQGLLQYLVVVVCCQFSFSCSCVRLGA
jgi:hypothetical protein